MNRKKDSDKKSQIITIDGKKFKIVWQTPVIIQQPCETCGKKRPVKTLKGKIIEVV